MIEQETLTSPYLRSIGEKAELISTLYQQRQQETQLTLEKLEAIIAEITQAQQEQAAKNIPPDIFAIYWILRSEQIATAEATANQMTPLFATYPYWRTSEEHERQLKQAMLKVFIQAKIAPKHANALVKEMLQVLKEARQ